MVSTLGRAVGPLDRLGLSGGGDFDDDKEGSVIV
jgi:hypothetical protein